MIRYADRMNYTTKNGREYLKSSKEGFVELINKSKSVFEVTEREDGLMKLYFDIDVKLNEGEKYEKEKSKKIEEEGERIIYEALKTVCEIEPKICVAISHGNNYKDSKTKNMISKYSVRYFVSNIKDKKNNIKNFVKDLNAYIKQSKEEIHFKGYDETIYGKNRLMRCVNSTKPGENRPLLLKKGKIEDSIITDFFDDDTIELKYNERRMYIKNNEDETTTLKECDIKNLEDISIPTKNLYNDTKSLISEITEHVEEDPEYVLKNGTKEEKITYIFDSLFKYNVFETYNNWLYLCFCIYNEFDANLEGYELLEKLSKKLTNFDESGCYKKYHDEIRKMGKNEKGIKIGTLVKMYREYYPKKKLIDTYKINKLMEEIINCNLDYDIAKLFVEEYGKNYVCLDTKHNIYYNFTEENIWELSLNADGGSKIKNILSTKIFEEFDKIKNDYLKMASNSSEEEKEEFKNKAKSLKKVFAKLKDNSAKNKVLKEINDQLINTSFEKDMNKKEYMLPIKNNKMFNIKTLEMRERVITDKFNYICNADYIQMTEEEDNDIKNYFLSLFCGNEKTMQCLIDIIKTVLVGKVTRYLYILTGSGRNGKSILFDILKYIFQGAMDVISEKVITNNNGGRDSGTTTEFEKMDKTRLGYVTELREEDRLNEKNIKKISGGDLIDLRPLFKSNITIKPICNLFVLTNEMPNFSIEQAIIDRMIIIPFKNRFEVDANFREKMFNKSDQIFTYIMKYGRIMDTFECSEEMNEIKMNYINNNINNDYLKEYIETYYEKVSKDDKTNKVFRDNFKTEYYEWCKMNDFKVKDMTYQKLSREMRNKFDCEIYESHNKTYYLGLKRNDKKIELKYIIV